MLLEHDIPKDGYLEINFPPEISLNEDEAAKSTGDNWKMKSSNSSSVYLQLTEEVKAGDKLEVEVLGVRNPRSFKPTKPFIIMSKDPVEDVIDIGGQDVSIIMT